MAGKRRYQTNHPEPFVGRLERVREKLGRSQENMAGDLGVPFRTYQKWVYAGQKPRHAAAILTRAEAMISHRRTNCWEALRCERGPGGAKATAEGLCPAAADRTADGVNNGTNGGRVCWGVSGTFCGMPAEGEAAAKLVSCLMCDFFSRVMREEGLANFKLLKPGQTYTQE